MGRLLIAACLAVLAACVGTIGDDPAADAGGGGGDAVVGNPDAVGAVDAGVDAWVPETEHDWLIWRLQQIPEPDFDPVAAVDWWESFVSTYRYRVRGSSANIDAAQHIEDALTEAGYEARILTFSSSVGTVRVVEGILPGEVSPDRYVGLVSHYDVVGGTVQGAYDNGSGVAVSLSLCKLLAMVPTQKTIACLFFDAEEVGLRGSKAYVNEYVLGDHPGFTFDMVFGFDMVGINWPSVDDWPLMIMAGLDWPTLEDYMDTNVAVIDVIAMEFLGEKLGVTHPGVSIIEGAFRNSDERIFKEAGVPAIRFAGGEYATDYDAYHRSNDTANHVYDVAGSRQNYEDGYEMIVLIAYYMILGYDSYDPLDLPEL